MKPYEPVRKIKKTSKKQKLSKRAKKAIKSKAKNETVIDSTLAKYQHPYATSEEVYFGIDEMDQSFT